MTQEQLDKIKAIRIQSSILAAWLYELVKSCDHRHSDGKDALNYLLEDHPYCEICHKEI